MNNLTFGGILVVLVALLPGYVFSSRYEAALPYKQPGAFELSLRYLALSVVFYAQLAVLLLLAGIICPQVWDLWTYVPETFTSHPLRTLCLGVLVVCALIAIAAFEGPWLARQLLRRTRDTQLAAFPVLYGEVMRLSGILEGNIRDVYALARLEDGSEISGRLVSISGDFETLQSSAKDIYLVDAEERSSPRAPWKRIEAPGVLINTRTIKLLMLTPVSGNDPPDN